MKFYKNIFLFGLLILLLFLSGCTIFSVNPFYEEGQITKYRQVIGTWQNKVNEDNKMANTSMVSDTETWTFKNGDKKGPMLLVVKNAEKTFTFSAAFFKINKKIFMDLYPNPDSLGAEMTSTLAINLLPVHTVSTVVCKKDTLEIDSISAEWVKNEILRKHCTLNYILTKDNMVLLTAESKDIFNYLASIDIDDAFSKGLSTTMVKKSN